MAVLDGPVRTPFVHPAGVRGRRPAGRELSLLAGLFLLYNAGRLLGSRGPGTAYARAESLLRLESTLALPDELSVQRWALATPELVRFLNGYYAAVHLPLTAAVLLWLYLRRPAHYVRVRRAIAFGTFAGLCLMILWPVAPPRLMPRLGFVDTGVAYGQSVYGSSSTGGLANQFAAMPSFHVGWAALVAAACIAAGSGRARWLWLAHPVLTVWVVVATGNHYWLDGVVGTALCLVPFALFGLSGRGESRDSRRPVVPRCRP